MRSITCINGDADNRRAEERLQCATSDQNCMMILASASPPLPLQLCWKVFFNVKWQDEVHKRRVALAQVAAGGAARRRHLECGSGGVLRQLSILWAQCWAALAK